MKKGIFLILLFFLLNNANLVSFAADTRQPIPELDISITVDGDLANNAVSINLNSPNYTINDISTNIKENTIIIDFEANEGYYFSLTKLSQVRLTGANHIKATKKNHSANLILTVSNITNGKWIDDENGRKFQLPNGTFFSEGWVALGFNYYYFDENGYILRDCETPDGYRVDKAGHWVKVLTQGSDEEETPAINEQL